MILLFIIHQIFLLPCDWSKCVRRLNIPQLKLGNILDKWYSQVIFPSDIPKWYSKSSKLCMLQKRVKDNKPNSLYLMWTYARKHWLKNTRERSNISQSQYTSCPYYCCLALKLQVRVSVWSQCSVFNNLHRLTYLNQCTCKDSFMN